MNYLSAMWLRFQALFRRRRLDTEMDEELRSHIEMQTQENMQIGMTAQEARIRALRSFGGLEPVKEICREERGGAWVENMIRDVRFGLRTLSRNPGFTVVAILALAFGTASATALFSIVDAVLLKPLPYRDPSRLVDICEKAPSGSRNSISPANFMDWRAQNHVFEAIAAYTPWSRNLTGAGEPEFVKGFQVSANFFDVLGGQFLLGRGFLPEEEQMANSKVAILSHTFLRNKFGGDTNIVGKAVLLDGAKFTVVGVVRLFSNSDQSWANVWTPLVLEPGKAVRNYHYLRADARLKPGVSLQQARTDLEGIARILQGTYPESNKGMGVELKAFRDDAVGTQLQTTLLAMFGAVIALLLLASVNVGGLMLARGLARQREVAIRLALGAGRSRLVRLFMVEGLLVSLSGGAIGSSLACAMLRFFGHSVPLELPEGVELVADLRIVAFSVAICLLAGLTSGMFPAWQASNPVLTDALNHGKSTTSPKPFRLRNGLVVAQIAVAMILLTGAGLLLHSVLRLWQVEPGINPHNVLACEIWLPQARYNSEQQFATFFQQALEQIGLLPGVRAAAGSTGLPLLGVSHGMPFSIEERSVEDRLGGGSAPFMITSPSYFRTMEIPVLKGRGLSEDDRNTSPHVAVISQAMAQHYFPEGNPIGKHVKIRKILPFNRGLGEGISWEIVGVVGNVRINGPADQELDEIYVSFTQHPFAGMDLTVRTTVEPLSLLTAVKRVVWQIDPNLTFTYVNTMDEVMSHSTAEPEFRSVLLGGFAVAALTLAAISIYGIIAFAVVQRRTEIGIRMALGAQRGDIFRLIMGQGVRLALSGLLLGGIGSVALTRLIKSLLFQTSPTDLATLAGTTGLVLAASLLACYFPTRRAARSDPCSALKSE
jgi:putative ABC transport system permease protein